MLRTAKFSSLIALAFLGACTTMPSGPSVLVLPGTGKSFDQFRADDYECKQFASAQLGGTTTGSAAASSGISSAAVGTVLGAAAGAAINGRSGAGVGAGTGLALGGLAGTGAAESSARGAQRRYDMGYQQCMYAKGHRVPVSGHFLTQPSLAQQPQTAPQAGHPPPPPGNPPPPPPGAPPPQ